MFLTSILTYWSLATLFIHPALCMLENRISVVDNKNGKYGTGKVLLYRKPFPAAMLDASNINPNITGIALSYEEHSEEFLPDQNYLVTGLYTLENIYHTHRNVSEVVTNYVYDYTSEPYNSTVLNISAVGRGREEGLPITFDYWWLVTFIRFFVEASRGVTYKWLTFGCYFLWLQESGDSENFPVASGNFTPLAHLPWMASPARGVQ
ncbi:MAG: hypothetical protein Q9216_005184 [Gyalolechia sp. 2 TL-2023]